MKCNKDLDSIKVSSSIMPLLSIKIVISVDTKMKSIKRIILGLETSYRYLMQTCHLCKTWSSISCTKSTIGTSNQTITNMWWIAWKQSWSWLLCV